MPSTGLQPCDEGVILSSPAAAPCSASAAPWILAATILGSSLAFIDGSVVNLALPAFQADLQATVIDAQWVIEAYSLLLAALILVGGSLGDIYGRRRVYAAGVSLFAASSIWCGLAPNIGQLIFATRDSGRRRCPARAGKSRDHQCVFSKTRARPRNRHMVGVHVDHGCCGTGPRRFPDRAWFLALGVLHQCSSGGDRPGPDVLAGVRKAAILTLPKRGLDRRDSGDSRSGGVVYALIESSQRGWNDRVVAGTFISGVVALAAFVIVEARSRSPLVPLTLFRSRDFAGANFLTLFLYCALTGLLFFFPLNLIQVQGYSATAAGASMLPFILLMFFMSRWSGGLSIVMEPGGRLSSGRWSSRSGS